MDKNKNLIILQELKTGNFVPYRVLLANVERIKKESSLDDNTSDDDIRNSMMYVQDIIVEKVTGSCLMDQLKLIIDKCVVNQPQYKWYKRLLDDFILPMLIYGVKADLSIENTLQIRNQGVVRNNDTQHLQYPALSDVKYAEQRQNYKLDFYIDRAVKFLWCNRHCFRELCGCGCPCGCDTAPYQRPYHTPLNLSVYPVKPHPYKKHGR